MSSPLKTGYSNFNFLNFNEFLKDKDCPKISKECFKLIFECINDELSKQNIFHKEYFLGYGNPDADILIVSTQLLLSALRKLKWWLNYSTSNFTSSNLINRNSLFYEEYENNFFNWYLTLIGCQNLIKPYNLFNPLLDTEVRENILKDKNHCYYGIERLINCYEDRVCLTKTKLLETNHWKDCTFSRFFLSGLNISIQKSDFKVKDFVGTNEIKTPSVRFDFMRNRDMGFYKSFKTVVLYVNGDDYNSIENVDSIEREHVLNLFNPELKNSDIKHHKGIIYYDSGKGARVIISRDFANGFKHPMDNILAELIK